MNRLAKEYRHKALYQHVRYAVQGMLEPDLPLRDMTSSDGSRADLVEASQAVHDTLEAKLNHQIKSLEGQVTSTRKYLQEEVGMQVQTTRKELASQLSKVLEDTRNELYQASQKYYEREYQKSLADLQKAIAEETWKQVKGAEKFLREEVGMRIKSLEAEQAKAFGGQLHDKAKSLTEFFQKTMDASEKRMAASFAKHVDDAVSRVGQRVDDLKKAYESNLGELKALVELLAKPRVIEKEIQYSQVNGRPERIREEHRVEME